MCVVQQRCAGAESLFAEYRRKIIRYTDASIEVEMHLDFYCFWLKEKKTMLILLMMRASILDTFVDRRAEAYWKPGLDFVCPLCGGYCVLIA